MWAWVPWMLPLLCKFSLAVLPAKPENISCILYYNKNFTCTWSPEEETSYTWYKVKRTFCEDQSSDTCNSTSENRASCSFFHSIANIGHYNIQVEAQNADGIVESDVTHWNLDDITKIEPPNISSVTPVLGIKRMVQIMWERPSLAPMSSVLNYMLRFRTVNSTRWMEVNFTKKDAGREQTYNLTGLQASTQYVVALQCAAMESQLWSGWSHEKMGTTEEEAPLSPDLWRVLSPAKVDGRRPVKLLWQKAKGAPVLEKTLGYNIWYFPENNTNFTVTENTTNQQLELYLEDGAYWVSVASYNSLGASPVATLRIPAIDEKSFQCIEAMQACLTQNQLVVEWQSSIPEVDSWMVEWFPDLDAEPSTFFWEPVSRARNWTIQQDKLEPFWCYNISVYPMLQDQVGQPYSIQAYVKEGIPSAGPVAKAENIGVKTVTITWKEIPKIQRNGFISNYTIFYQAEDGKEFSKTVSYSILQYGLESLTRKTSYTVQVMASTSAGGINGTRISFKTLPISVFEICLITSLVGGGLLILIILTVAYGLKKPIKLKHLCWPDVPNPAKSSIATWHEDDFKDKLNLSEFDDSLNTEEDRILKPCFAPKDFIDKLVVNFENFLEEASTEKPGKAQEHILGGEKNEYVTSPYRPYYSPGESFVEPPISTEIPSRRFQHLCSEMLEQTFSEAEEQLPYSTQSLGPDHLCEEGIPNPYLKNSMITREFLLSEKLPNQAKRED